MIDGCTNTYSTSEARRSHQFRKHTQDKPTLRGTKNSLQVDTHSDTSGTPHNHSELEHQPQIPSQ
jgi:hypothetical protein